MPRVTTFTVVPKLPQRLERLREIAFNMWWCWSPEAIELFFRIDRDLWVKNNQNPVKVLGLVGQHRFEELAEDDSFLAHLDRVAARLDEYMSGSSWLAKHPEAPRDFHIAYFSAEFGLQESISIYSGGLGVLAGDHLKSASDLGLPLTAVGLLYRSGYFRQYLNADGWQQELYPRNDFYNMAISLVRDKDGAELLVEVEYPERLVKARIWRCQVGRVPLYLLDTDLDQNHVDDREITGQLYGGDYNMRVRQEILLGMGGVKALQVLGVEPTVYHMNEGHAAFMTLQRIRDLIVEKKLTLPHAVEVVKASGAFTTHTPVPAGNDVFTPSLMKHFFSKYAHDAGMSMDDFLAWGRQDPGDSQEPFCLTVLAMKLSATTNGVSALHGHVARGMWSRVWRDIPQDEVPITSITNGVHTRFWISRDLAGLYDRYLGPDWVRNPDDQSIWKRIDEVPDAELYRTHERRRERLVTFARRRLVQQLKQRGAPPWELETANEVLDPEVLTIGFARRFATYKRANLILMDPDRLTRILTHAERPVQIIIAGKAHPADNQGKEMIRTLVHYARNPEVRSHFLFLEDYDMNVARYMVQGVDCWLNTPRRPNEASGTSGMKASANGALNISVPDGWWCEAELLGENGWSIGRGETYDDPHEQDIVESEALYEILEKEVVPTFYDGGKDGLPRRWTQRMKNAIRTICPVFNTNRMLEEYTSRCYLPCARRYAELTTDNAKRAQALADWKAKIRHGWNNVRVREVKSSATQDLPFGSQLMVSAWIGLDNLSNEDVVAEIYYGDLDAHAQIATGRAVPMRCLEKHDGNVFRFEGAIHCDKTGRHGFTVRVIPRHPDLAQKHETTLITWY